MRYQERPAERKETTIAMMIRAETTSSRAVKTASVLSLALALSVVCGYSRSFADNFAGDDANATLTHLNTMHLVRYLFVGGDPVCSAHETDATTRPIPPALAPAVITAFAVSMTPAEVAANGVIRCADGHLLACLVGANLNCGKADTRTRNPDASAWCRDHPNADFVPAAVTGHETIYTWRCDGTRAVIDRQVEQVDPQGFVAGNWRRVSSHRDR